MDRERYKSLLIINESSVAQVTLYIYPRWDFLCWLSFESKIIKPHKKYLHRSDKRFKYEVVARFEDSRPKKTLQRPEEWVEDKLLKITESLYLTEEKLADFPVEKTVCVRKLQRDRELKSTNGRRNLYDILGLDMDQVRKMPKEEQIKAIKKGFQREIQRWHPDKNFGDDEIAKEIMMAREILQNDEMRARYHNEADYDAGWLSPKRWKAIFRPECFSKEQQTGYRDRMKMFAASLGITVVGMALTAVTAGLAAPVWVATGAVFGGGLTGAGMQSLQHTVNRESVVDGCDKKNWLMKAGIGFVGGAATGGAAAGITGHVAGLGSSAVESAALTAGQYIGIGAGSGAVAGVSSSLASDATRKFVDGEHVTWKQVLGHAVSGAAICAAAGAASGFVTKSIVDSHTSAAAANLEGEIGEQILLMPGTRRLGNTLARNIPRALTENGTEAVMGSVALFAEERLDDSVENRNPGEHLVDGVKNLVATSAKTLAMESGSALASHTWNEVKVAKRAYKKLETPLELVEEDEHITSRKAPGYLPKEDNEQLDLVNWRSHSKTSCSYRPLHEVNKSSAGKPGTLRTVFKEDGVRDEPKYCKINYIFEANWISKMIVSYFLNGREVTQEVSGSGMFVTVPSKARRVEVRFQVRRPFWDDIKKYDRFRRLWCQPYDEPHVFRYYTPPPLRTFTISGNPWCEAVTRVSNEYHNETYEL